MQMYLIYVYTPNGNRLRTGISMSRSPWYYSCLLQVLHFAQHLVNDVPMYVCLIIIFIAYVLDLAINIRAKLKKKSKVGLLT